MISATQAPRADVRVVCIGTIHAQAHVHFIPFPRQGGQQPTTGAWPAIKVTLVREPSPNVPIIYLKDPTYRTFGKLDVRTAKGLSRLMDNMQHNGMHIKAKLESRKRIGGEIAGSPTSGNLKLQITLTCPRATADDIGGYLNYHHVLLKDPTDYLGLGVELYNPHAPKPSRILPWTSNGNGTSYGMAPAYVNRTMEEVAGDVMNVFDSLPSHDELAQKQQDPRVITPLLVHQAQALTFMTEREKNHDIPKEGEPQGSSLWKIQYRPNGVRVFYNILTGKSNSPLSELQLLT
jgi:hypothetical protein